jgi:diguanylate cyclase (GGDEF)-like protein
MSKSALQKERTVSPLREGVATTAPHDAAGARDVVSNARDAAATARDRAAEYRELTYGPRGPGFKAAIRRSAEVRFQAAADRAHAATDREHAAGDRRRAQADLERAVTDDLTGAYRRHAGEIALEHEVARARRSGETLVLVFADVDALKATNDQFGHAAGDARLRDAVSAMQAKTRSYEPIVRYGGDEFLCSITGVDLATVRARFARIDSVLTMRDHPGSLSVGLAQLRDGETLTELIKRADEALITTRGSL